MAADATVQFRVTPEVKAMLHAVATREQISESALVRQLVETMLRAQSGPVEIGDVDRLSRDERLTIRMDGEDRLMLKSRAGARGMRSATYVSVLLRSHLRGVTPMPKDELLAMKRSIAELRAIGNNLNQIARAIHQGNLIVPGYDHLAAMLKVAEGLLDHFKALLIANERSWRLGHAKPSDEH